VRILQITNKMPFPPKDGGAIATLNISKGLARQGHDITILAMNTSKHYVHPDELPHELTQQVTIKEVEVITDISFGAAIRNLIFSSKPYNAERFFNNRFNEELTGILKKDQFDIIQLEGLYLAFYIDTIRKYSRAKISLRAHNIEHEIWERTAAQEKSLWKRFYFNILARRIKNFEINMLNKYDLLIPITERDANHYATFGNVKPTHVVPAGFELNSAIPHPEQIKFPSVFFIGTLDWFPNQEGLLWFLEKVWPLVLRNDKNMLISIAGRNAPRWFVNQLNKFPNVNFLGEIEDAHQFIAENAIMIAPLFSGSGMRVKIIEGMALGKTIITTTIGAEGIDVSNGENILIENDPEKFAGWIVELVNNRFLFDAIGRNAINFVGSKYDNDKISQSLASFYLNQLKSS
jgi:polysaccharide biosynthesis protein PslH